MVSHLGSEEIRAPVMPFPQVLMAVTNPPLLLFKLQRMVGNALQQVANGSAKLTRISLQQLPDSLCIIHTATARRNVCNTDYSETPGWPAAEQIVQVLQIYASARCLPYHSNLCSEALLDLQDSQSDDTHSYSYNQVGLCTEWMRT